MNVVQNMKLITKKKNIVVRNDYLKFELAGLLILITLSNEIKIDHEWNKASFSSKDR